MKSVVLILLPIVCFGLDGTIRNKIKDKLQQSRNINFEIIKKEDPQVQKEAAIMPLILLAPPESLFRETNQPNEGWRGLTQGERLAKTEAYIENIKEEIKTLKENNKELQSTINDIADNLVLQAKTTQTQDKRGERFDLILNIIFGLISIGGGGAVSIWFKNRKLIKLPVLQKTTKAD